MDLSTLLERLKRVHGITDLLPVQQLALDTVSKSADFILVSPTGTGKTIAFVLPALLSIKQPIGVPQLLIIAPARELVIQIQSVLSPLVPEYKISVLYGGHDMRVEQRSLTSRSGFPDIIIATPGRLVDHLQRHNLQLHSVHTLVVDEYDKTLSLGFEPQIKRIAHGLPKNTNIILTSATPLSPLPALFGTEWHPVMVCTEKSNAKDMLDAQDHPKITLARTCHKDKLSGLHNLLSQWPLSEQPVLVFVNHRESADRVYSYLRNLGYPVALYHGGLEQDQRENSLNLFDNGTLPLMVATDLAARGLDLSKVSHIVHYHSPVDAQTWTHRNGRTNRQGREKGDVTLIIGPEDEIPEYCKFNQTIDLDDLTPQIPSPSQIATLYLHEGKKDKISKGDIVGFILSNSQLAPDDIGPIYLADHHALVAIPANQAEPLIDHLSSLKLKGRKRRITLVTNDTTQSKVKCAKR